MWVFVVVWYFVMVWWDWDYCCGDGFFVRVVGWWYVDFLF